MIRPNPQSDARRSHKESQDSKQRELQPLDSSLNAFDRRSFLVGTGLTAIAAGTHLPAFAFASSHSNSEDSMIDTHQHLWNLDEFDLPWLEGNERLSRNFLIPEYQEATRELPIERTVYMEVGMAQHEQVREAEWVIEMCDDPANKMAGAVIAGQPFERSFRDYVDRFSEHPAIKGVRHLLIGDTPQGTCLEEEYQEGVRYLGQKGLRFDICIRSTELMDAVELIKSCPETQFVLDHCGNADPVAWAASHRRFRPPQHDADEWNTAIAELGNLDNVVCKISGIIARVNPHDWSAFDLRPIVEHCRNSFGPHRIIFASDWPVCLTGAPLKEWVGALKEIAEDWSEAEQRQLFRENAIAFYELD